jgi:hypothetical protein
MANVFQRGFSGRRTLARHGRLTPAAPAARRPFAVKSRITVRSRTRTKSGGFQPAVVGETHLQERFRKVAGDCRQYAHERRCSRSSEPTGGLRPPLLLQCERLSAKKRFLRCTNARSQERRVSARRGFGKLVCVDASALVRLTADGVWGDRHCIRVNRYHGGLTPPALVAVRTFVGEKTIFAMHKRTLTSAGNSFA